MKIINSNQINDPKIVADICIIGSGPAGMTLAKDLSSENLDIVVADSGRRGSSEKANELNVMRVESNFRYRNGESKRARQIGGTASIWAGRVVPFRFNPTLDKEWGKLSTSVQPYYDEALKQLNIDPEILNEHPHSNEEFYSYWAFKTQRFKPLFFTSVSNKTRIYTNLTFTGGAEFSNESVSELCFTNQNKKEIFISAKRFVFAMGTIENCRMLLIMGHQLDRRMGRNFDNVGKFIMDHPRIFHGSLHPESGSQKTACYHMKTTKYGLYKTGIRGECDNVRVYCDIKGSPDRFTRRVLGIPFKSFQYSAKKLQIRETGVIQALASQLTSVPPLSWSEFITHKLKDFANNQVFSNYRVMTYCEQKPRPQNKIVLDKETDTNGLKIPRLTNSIHPKEVKEVVLFYRYIKNLSDNLRYKFHYDEEYVCKPEHFTDASHMMGGTRYSCDKSKSVVDENLTVVGVPNLHIAGSSVFPTSGVENPTHLITSLSLYLADILRHHLF